MNCDCISNIEKDACAQFPEFKITGKSIMMPEFKYGIVIAAEYLPEGKKKKKSLPLVATYCPFCGKYAKHEIEEVPSKK